MPVDEAELAGRQFVCIDQLDALPGKYVDEEVVVMKTHARKGREMIDDLVNNFGLHNIKHIHILRNIAEFHPPRDQTKLS